MMLLKNEEMIMATSQKSNRWVKEKKRLLDIGMVYYIIPIGIRDKYTIYVHCR